jgi:hypothetical protein
MDAIGDEVFKGHWQAAVVIAAVVRKLNLNSVNDPSPRKGQRSPCWAFEHFD